ncbi:MAG: universal stress protein [Vicinamibacterales bacterium]
MKILIATDGSAPAAAAVAEVAARAWPEGSEVKVLTVIHTAVPFATDPALVVTFIALDHLDKARKHAPEVVERAAAQLARPGLTVTTAILEGSPKQLIVDEAERWGADLVVLGTHGHGAPGRFVLGSVAHSVVLHAPCSVEVVRKR